LFVLKTTARAVALFLKYFETPRRLSGSPPLQKPAAGAGSARAQTPSEPGKTSRAPPNPYPARLDIPRPPAACLVLPRFSTPVIVFPCRGSVLCFFGSALGAPGAGKRNAPGSPRRRPKKNTKQNRSQEKQRPGLSDPPRACPPSRVFWRLFLGVRWSSLRPDTPAEPMVKKIPQSAPGTPRQRFSLMPLSIAARRHRRGLSRFFDHLVPWVSGLGTPARTPPVNK